MVAMVQMEQWTKDSNGTKDYNGTLILMVP